MPGNTGLIFTVIIIKHVHTHNSFSLKNVTLVLSVPVHIAIINVKPGQAPIKSYNKPKSCINQLGRRNTQNVPGPETVDINHG